MQSSEMSSYGSLPTLNSAVSSSDCEKTDAGSRAAHSLTAVDAEVQVHVYKSKLKKKWNLGQKLKCVLQRSTAIYSVLIVAIWTMFTIPIIVFYATDAKVIYCQIFICIVIYSVKSKSKLTIIIYRYCDLNS